MNYDTRNCAGLEDQSFFWYDAVAGLVECLMEGDIEWFSGGGYLAAGRWEGNTV